VTEHRFVINKSIPKHRAGTQVDNVRTDLLQHKVPTTGQTSGERTGQPVGKKSIHGDPTDG
jgi:hypothetical protein